MIEEFISCFHFFDPGEELNTFPSDKPKKCIDYIWFKGKNIKVDSAYTFGSSDATDHKGIKAIFNIT